MFQSINGKLYISMKNRLEEVQVFSDEIVFGVAYVYASFNDTFVHVTDLLGKSRLIVTRLALRCYVAALYVGGKCKSLGITSLHMKLRAAGGTCTKTPGPGAQSGLGALARSSMNIVKIINIL
ncbi:40S ribosomal protein S14-B [Culex quinquefasciatus]|uniref:40S ribosomal protein S14-B n=1 Tax=Culex quinquefasciatus TaxID=7176 RepID=B0X6L4_CULQU|nr:40S ribosomal protein S14-B [Culex quinquefasciatus]|eukprot:XP_001865286.1 40S ribosomal protein S14-B [Culex quinquefasciatus]